MPHSLLFLDRIILHVVLDKPGEGQRSLLFARVLLIHDAILRLFPIDCKWFDPLVVFVETHPPTPRRVFRISR